MSTRHTRELICEYEGPLARWTRPESQADPLSHRIPTPEAHRGLLSGIHHTRSLFFWPIRLEILAYLERDPWTDEITGIDNTPEIRFAPVSAHMIDESKNGGNRWYGSPAVATFLYKVRHRLFFCAEGPETHLDEFERRLTTGAFDNPPYLGVRECIARVTNRIGSDVPLDISFTEPAVRLAVGGPVADLHVRHGVLIYPPETRKALVERREASWLRKRKPC